MANFVYNTAAKEMADLNQTIDLEGDTIKVMLCTSSYVANRDNDFIEEGANDANEHELSGTGYTAGFGGAGRKTLGTKSWAVDKTNDRAEFDCADITWTAIDAGTVSQILVIKEITADTASRLIAHIDDGGLPIVTNGGDLTVTINAEGLIQLGTT